MLNVQKIRQDFPILKRKATSGKPLIYLDNAATSQKPYQVLAAIQDYYLNHNANIHRGIHFLSEEAGLAYEQARGKVARFIGCQKDELIFTKNTTEAINLVAFSWGRKNLKKGDLILVSEMEHHSNLVPWLQLAKSTGCKVEYIKVGKIFLLNWNDFKEKLKLKPKLVCITHASNVLGTINPIAEITKLCHKAGAKVLVDGAQSVPHFPVSLKKIGCDFFAFSGHKMLGPMGIGCLYVRREILEEMEPFLTGGGMINQVYKNRVVFADLPDKFEAGTPNVAGAVGLGAAVDYLEKIGLNKVLEHEQSLVKYALEQLKVLGNITVYGPRDLIKRSGVIALTLAGIHAHDLAQALDDQAIAVRSGHHCTMVLHTHVLKVPATIRISFYLYNTFEEVDHLIEGLKKAEKIFL